MNDISVSLRPRAKWHVMFASGVLIIALMSLSSPAQDAPTKTPAPATIGKAKVSRPAVAVTASLKLSDASGNVFLTAKKYVTKKTNGFDFLRETLVVDFTTFPPDMAAKKPFPGGPFVNALAGVSPDAGTYWALYVDGKYSCVGISSITIDVRDILIEWKMEKFSVPHPECN
jgi:hypothetical protein